MKPTSYFLTVQMKDIETRRLLQLLFRGFFPLCAALALLGVGTASAQNYLTNGGEPTFSAPEPVELGFTDAANGQLHLEIGLGAFPQRGSNKPLTIRLVYNSNIWKIGGIAGSYSWQVISTSDPPYDGWRLVPSTSRAWAYVGTDSGCQSHGSWTDEAGTERWFPLTTVSACATSTNGYAADSSGYRFYYILSSGNVVASIYAPDGSLACVTAPNQWPCVQMEDNNGNQINFSASPANTDTIGRVLPLTGIPSGGQINVPNSQGGTSLYQVANALIPVRSAFGQSGVTEYSGNIYVIQSITLPDNTRYNFKYDCDSSTGNAACGSPSGQSGYYGLPISVMLPAGGQISYGWTTFTDSYGNKARWLNSRTSAGGLWTYSPQAISTCSSTQVGCQQKMTVTKPYGAKTVYTFTLNNGAWPVQIQSLDGAGNVLSTVNNTYDFSIACPFFNCQGAGYIRLLTSQATVAVPGGASITKQTTYAYDSPQTGNVTALKEWRYYSGSSPVFPSVPDRATYATYLTTGTNNINRPLKVTVCNNSGSDTTNCPGGGSRVSQTVYTYDSYSSCASGLTSVPGVVNHDDANFGSSYTQRGNPTQIQRWVSGSTYLTTKLCYDTTGQVLQAFDPAGNPTTYNYTDNFFNDTGAASMSAYTPPAPTNAYAKTITAGGLTTKFGYYFGSGKRASSTDPNSVTTSYFFFDSLDRPTQSAFLIGWSLTNYTGATQADTYVPVADTSASATCTSCRHKQITLDTWGRKINEQLVNAPGGAVNLDTTYDAQGRIQSLSHAYVNSSDPSHVFESFSYDVLDRRNTVTHPDGQSSRTAYGAAVGTLGGVTTQQSSTTTYGFGYPIFSVDETGKERQEWLDGFGRIIELDEQTTSGTPGTGTVTITGTEQTVTFNPCPPFQPPCSKTVPDAGTVSITVGGYTASVWEIRQVASPRDWRVR